MLRSECVLGRVLIRRAVTTQRHAAGLTRSQVNPATPDLHTLFTRTPLRKFDELNRFNMRASLFSHTWILHLHCRRALANRFSSFLDDTHDRCWV